ncbi:MAG: hypothetical protein ACTSUE_09385 [Promethearchaeota archaeon]
MTNVNDIINAMKYRLGNSNPSLDAKGLLNERGCVKQGFTITGRLIGKSMILFIFGVAIIWFLVSSRKVVAFLIGISMVLMLYLANTVGKAGTEMHYYNGDLETLLVRRGRTWLAMSGVRCKFVPIEVKGYTRLIVDPMYPWAGIKMKILVSRHFFPRVADLEGGGWYASTGSSTIEVQESKGGNAWMLVIMYEWSSFKGIKEPLNYFLNAREAFHKAISVAYSHHGFSVLTGDELERVVSIIPEA